MDISEIFSNWIFFIPGLALYFVPTFAATFRKTKNAFAIFLLNLLLGFTFVGWVVALVWAFAGQTESKPVATSVPKPNRFVKGYGSQQF